MTGRADYEERRQARIDRLNGAAEKATAESEVQCRRSHDLVKDIPFGQPNIIGRPALPRLRERSARAMDKAVEADSKADYYAGRAEAAERNHAISSDDPEAIPKLKAKLATLEGQCKQVKASNKAARAAGKEPAPWYTLPYLGKEIRRIKDRIAQLERLDSQPVAEDIHFDGGIIHENTEINRLQIIFDSIPDPEIRSNLKRWGFKWARSEGAWQRLRGSNALHAAKRALGLEG
jgi:hypothetical protein